MRYLRPFRVRGRFHHSGRITRPEGKVTGAGVLGLMLLALSTFSPVAVPASHGGPDTQDPRDWVEGVGLVAVDSAHFPGNSGDTLVFDASTGPNGSATGAVTITTVAGLERFRGRVRCVAVHEHSATLGGDVLDGVGAETGGKFAVRVTDNRTREDVPLDVILFSAGEETTGDCTVDDWLDGADPVLVVGNATVHDAE